MGCEGGNEAYYNDEPFGGIDEPPSAGEEFPKPEATLEEEPPPEADNTQGEVLDHKTFEETDDEIMNPERGFYTWVDLFDDDDFNSVREKGYTIAFAPVLLDAYLNSPIDEGFLENLAAGMAKARDAGIKLILRFRYSDDSDDSVTDAPLNMIEDHIAQIASILDENSDAILLLEAGFIGRWGEWHSSSNGLDNPDSRAAVIDALLDALPESRMIELRRPWFKTDFLSSKEPLDAEVAFDGSAAARIGHHNDCFLADDTDMGTYPEGEVEFWKDFIAGDALYVPMGGETCKVNEPKTGCEYAMDEMGRLRWTYLNSGYHKVVTAGWKAEGCYDEIGSHLGYRFVLTDLWWNPRVGPGGILHLKFRVSNEGFAAPFNERPVHVILQGENTYVADLNADPRFWAPGGGVVVEDYIELPDDVQPGQYKLALWLPDAAPSLEDDASYAIRLADDGAWDADAGVNVLTAVTVDAAVDYKHASAPTTVFYELK